MPVRHLKLLLFHAVLLCLPLATARTATGMEHVVLSNGFAVDCHHRAVTSEGKVRLFLKEDESSYIDVDNGRIRSSEVLPDQPLQLSTTNLVAAPSSALPSGLPIEAMIAAECQSHGLNVDLLKSVVQAESGGHARAVSRTGAQGLMQLMPATAKSLGVSDSFAPEQNLRGGTSYLDRLLVRYHDDLPLALAAYNAGPGAVDKYHGVPPYRETQAYVARIIHEFNRRTLLAQRSALAKNPASR